MNLANKITISRICLIPLLIIFLQSYPTWLIEHSILVRFINEHGMLIAAIIFIIAASTDKLDGYIARKYNQITNLGKLLDPLADKLLISTALIMLVQVELISSWIAIIIIGREIIITGIRLVASAQGIALAADKFGKYKLVMQVVAITGILLSDFIMTFVTKLPIAMIMMWIAVIMTLYSGYNYIKNNYKSLQLEI